MIKEMMCHHGTDVLVMCWCHIIATSSGAGDTYEVSKMNHI
jgi:hypothetical protein